MALTSTQLREFTDSLAQACSDFHTNFVTATATPATTINTVISGTGVSQTAGRVLNFLDLASEANMLDDMQTVSSNIAAYLTSIRSLSGFYQKLYPVLDALDLSLSGGLNAFLTAAPLQINAHVATAFNNYQLVAVGGGFRSSANTPIAIALANYFPYAAVDDLWEFTSSAATTFSSNAFGANANTDVAGSGVGQLYIYKVNAGNAAGGATFTITYINAAGASVQTTYNTASGTPVASGSLSAGYAVGSAVGKSIVSVTGSGMTAGEQFRLGIKLTRSPAY